MKLIIKSWTQADSSMVRETIVKGFDLYVKKYGLDNFESRLDVLCLDFASQLGYVFEREDDDLIFIQRGIA